MENYIETLNFGRVIIRYDKCYMFNDIIDIIETCDENFYEIRKSYRGELVAIKVEEN